MYWRSSFADGGRVGRGGSFSLSPMIPNELLREPGGGGWGGLRSWRVPFARTSTTRRPCGGST
eukprot:10014002-Alexandrium_andersonii.AAC.1